MSVLTANNNLFYEAVSNSWTAMTMKNSYLWDVTPCSPMKATRRFGRTYRLHSQGRRTGQARNQLLHSCFIPVSYLAYSSTLRMEVIYPSEKSVYFQRTTRRYPRNHRCECWRSNIIAIYTSWTVKPSWKSVREVLTHLNWKHAVTLVSNYPMVAHALVEICNESTKKEEKTRVLMVS